MTSSPQHRQNIKTKGDFEMLTVIGAILVAVGEIIEIIIKK